MKHKKYGFTLIEVSLFLAVTGVIFVSIIAGTQGAIWQQKYNDSVQSYANFLRDAYAQASNPQSLGAGKGKEAIYGKLISFGQEYNLKGGKVADDNKSQEIFIYDVVADADGDKTGSIDELLVSLNISLIVEEGLGNGDTAVTLAGFTESYTPTWGAVIETTAGGLYQGEILIVRHPRSGTVSTLVRNSGGVMPINQMMKEKNYDGLNEILRSALSNGEFVMAPVDFCVNPYGAGVHDGLRRDVRLVRNARNASGVEIIDLDAGGNLCAL